MMHFRSNLTRAVVGHFMLSPDSEMFVNELARRFKLDSGNLARQLVRLEKEGLFKSRLSGSQRYYSLNRDYPLLEEYRKIVLTTFGLEGLLRIALGPVAGISKAVIFGSYAADRMDAVSDVDLLVIGTHDVMALNRAIAALQKKVDRLIHTVSMTDGEYQRKKNKDAFLRSVEKGAKVIII